MPYRPKAAGRVLFSLPASLDVMPGWWRGRSGQRACCASYLDRSRRFSCDLLGVAICRESGPPDDPGLVFFFGQGLLEAAERWGLTGMQVEDPGGIGIVLAAVAGHGRVTAVAVARAQGRG